MGVYIRLVDYKSQDKKEEAFLKTISNKNSKDLYNISSQNFTKIPGSPIAYWISNKYINLFEKDNIGKYSKPLRGYATADGDIYVKNWNEVNINEIYFLCRKNIEAYNSEKKWFPYNKGGIFRKWYGNNDKIVDYYKNGENYKNIKGFCFSNQKYYFNESITWSKISSGNSSFRYNSSGFIFGDAGPALYSQDNLIYYMSILNCVISNKIQSYINPTLNTTNETVAAIPVIQDKEKINFVLNIANQNIELSKQDWDQFETSWDFFKNPLI
jgi:hypothetical protein